MEAQKEAIERLEKIFIIFRDDLFDHADQSIDKIRAELSKAVHSLHIYNNCRLFSKLEWKYP